MLLYTQIITIYNMFVNIIFSTNKRLFADYFFTRKCNTPYFSIIIFLVNNIVNSIVINKLYKLYSYMLLFTSSLMQNVLTVSCYYNKLENKQGKKNTENVI